MKLFIVLLATIAMTSGCATTVHYPENARSDWISCKSEIDRDQSYGIGPLAQIVRNMAYDRCMADRGWRKTGPNT